ncbi:MAG: adenylosuccinate lyase family protein [Kaiparowitsia implicata GSE-PSE-MK54-09C]|jgi:3-carboxy-cis,cis-muconate cycloisomerase|nr:adenylosuccinate lyase family protein [Kaiparowitsia implicata GSE-PSE-MK54-09C]
MSLASTAPGLLTQTIGYKRAADVFGEVGTVDAYLAVEAALAEVEGDLGVIPPEAVAPIVAACRRDAIDMDELRTAAAIVGYPIVPLVSMLANRAGESGQWVHFGTTTQDVMDTAQVLQLREALTATLVDTARIELLLGRLCDLHRRTPMVGRSKLQHGVPISFGYKIAVWLDQVFRTRTGLARALDEASVLQFGGAVGTLASLRNHGMGVRRRLAWRLSLSEPDISWHASRDRMVALAGSVAALLGALAKIAVDVAHLMSTEVGELREPAAAGRGSSSTMPQKRNPVICEAIIEAARGIQHVPGILLGAMLQEHERGIGHGYSERAALSDSVLQLSGAVSLTEELLAGLEVDTSRMAQNLNLTNGLVYTEAMMIHLSDRIGRIEAHRVLHNVSHRVIQTGADLETALQEETGMALPSQVLDFDLQVEAAQEMIEQVLDTVSFRPQGDAVKLQETGA